MNRKTYIDLKDEVWDRERCAGCGACVAVCPADAIIFGEGPDLMHPVHSGYCKEETDAVPCGACYSVCPRTDEKIRVSGETALIGDHAGIIPVKAGFPIERKQSGGAVTALLSHALSEGLVDAVVVVGEDPLTLKPFSALLTSADAPVHHAGSRYNWWVPTLAILKEAVVTRKYRRLAVVGVPCAVDALREMRESDHDLLRPFGNAIRLIIGLFCTESFDYSQLVVKTLQKNLGIEPWQIRRLNVKGALKIEMLDGSVTELPLAGLEPCVRPGCRSCIDLTARRADISAGAIGSPAGYTTLIVRNNTGLGIVTRAIDAGALIAGDDIDFDAIEGLARRKDVRKAILSADPE